MRSLRQPKTAAYMNAVLHRNSIFVVCCSCRGRTRWAWQSIPVLQLPPVQTSVDDSPLLGKSIDGASQPPPRGAVARVESRVMQVKEDNGVENALRTAEEILRLRHR